MSMSDRVGELGLDLQIGPDPSCFGLQGPQNKQISLLRLVI